MASRKANVAGVATELQRIRGIGWPANSKKDRLRWAESVLNVPNKSAGVKLSKWQQYDLERVGISSRASGGFEVGADVLRCYGTAVVYNLVYYAYELISGNNDDVDIRRTSEHAKLQQQYRQGTRNKNNQNHARGKIIDCNQQSQASACDFAYLEPVNNMSFSGSSPCRPLPHASYDITCVY